VDEKDVDLALPPFQGQQTPPRLLSALPSLYRKAKPNDLGEDIALVEGDVGEGITQHFGPAPTGRIGRRTHNAAGHNRIKHSATLDDNGFFAIDMPIPTRLAQFLPFKGVEEQKTTR
jgi:chitin synthase